MAVQEAAIVHQALGDTLGGLLSDSARRFPANRALVIKPGVRTRVTTYAELEQLSLRCARFLQVRGIEKGDRVLLWAPNMPQWVALYFGCMKIGAVLVPLDVRSEADFAATIARQTDPKLVVASRLTARFVEELGAPAIQLEQLEALLPAQPGSNEPGVAPDDLAEIVFTSGTTGDPKGVMLTHRNIVTNVRGTQEVLTIEERFRLLSLLPLSHMFEQTIGMLAPLSGGASIAYPVSRQPTAMFRTLTENRITMMCLVPQALDLFMSAIEREARRQNREAMLARLFGLAERLPMPARRLLFRSIHAKLGGALELLICGGAYLDPALAHRWELMGITVLQGYGATEAAPIIACDRLTQRKPDAVGLPYTGVDVRIDTDGEILAKGPNIFSGYWNNPQATAAVLQDGWYRTGDLGSIDEQGFLHLKGRKKDLIVLANGQNVYPEDIETELDRNPAVSEAVVVGLQKDRGDVEVHAVLLMKESDRAAEAVRTANDRLADHQRVQGFTVWPHDDFPRTHTLKVKKRDVLEELSRLRDGTVPEQASAAPQVAMSPIVRLAAELAAIDASGIMPESRLGDLGLDSLGRVELLSAIEDELGAYIDESLVSPDTTVGELETMVGEASGTRAETRFVTWPLGPIAAVARELFLQLIIFPLYHLFWRVRAVGQEGIRGIRQPVIVAANHHFGNETFGFDPAALWMALPRELRLKTCTAGEEHAVFDRPIRGFLARLVNAFPLSKSGNVRGSLEYIGRLLDLGWSVLIFPEGKLTLGGPMQPFLGGTGLVAVEGGTPVVPIYVHVERECILQRRGGPWRGAFTMYIGEPLEFSPGSSPIEATERIEAAVVALEAQAKGLAPTNGLATPVMTGNGSRPGARRLTAKHPDDGLTERLFAREWPAARAAWKVSDPVLHRAAPTTPVDRPIDEMPTHFAALTRSILHQQLSIASGRAISARFLAACGGSWTPEAVRALSDEELLAAGLSRAKARYVAALADAALRGDLTGIEALSDEEIIARLVTVPGIGTWTAKMFLLFHLRRPDIFSGDDLGLRLGIALLEGRENPPSASEAEARAEAWRPYCSVASLVLWDLVRRTRADRTANRTPPRGDPPTA